MKVTVVLVPLLAMILPGIRSKPQAPEYLPPTGGASPGAPPSGAAPSPAAAPPSNTGHPDEWAGDPVSYEFSYEIMWPLEGLDFGHKEMRKDDTAMGSYHVLLPDGRTQYVDYIADQNGYRPMIRYEGTITNVGPGPGSQMQGGGNSQGSQGSPLPQPGPGSQDEPDEDEGYKY